MSSRRLVLLFNFVRKFAGRIRIAFRVALRVLIKGEPEPYVDRDGSLQAVLSGSTRAPGFPCPRCGVRIRVDIASLMAKANVVCPGCSLKLNMEWDSDKRAQEVLERFQKVATQVEEAKAFRR